MTQKIQLLLQTKAQLVKDLNLSRARERQLVEATLDRTATCIQAGTTQLDNSRQTRKVDTKQNNKHPNRSKMHSAAAKTPQPYSNACITTTKENTAVDQNGDNSEETERERLIRTGQMTPFGTILSTTTKKGTQATNTAIVASSTTTMMTSAEKLQYRQQLRARRIKEMKGKSRTYVKPDRFAFRRCVSTTGGMYRNNDNPAPIAEYIIENHT